MNLKILNSKMCWSYPHWSAKGKTIVMPAGIPHAVTADGKFKMLLTVVFPQE
jgi:quercetin dioxygenase-like cupin family protein